MNTRPALFGRFQTPEAPSALLRLHLHDEATPLHTVDWEPNAGVLDQQDLLAQGIETSSFIPGCKTNVNELGSCTANATIVYLSNILRSDQFSDLPKTLGIAPNGSRPLAYDNVVLGEEAAIGFYHRCTDQTGTPAQEWPPTDCGSSGPYIFEYLKHLKLVSTEAIAHGPQNLVSLLQKGAVLVGQPFLNAWMEPGPDAMIDGNGTVTTVERQIQDGVAGGHETVITAIEKLVLNNNGQVNPWETIIRLRNSWAKSWGDHGSYRAHLSTYTVILGQYCDFRQPTV
jgi:hypothetical protein